MSIWSLTRQMTIGCSADSRCKATREEMVQGRSQDKEGQLWGALGDDYVRCASNPAGGARRSRDDRRFERGLKKETVTELGKALKQKLQ